MGLQNLPLWLLLIPPKRNTELPMPDPTALRVLLAPYNAIQIGEILQKRVAVGFNEGVFEDTVAPRIAEVGKPKSNWDPQEWLGLTALIMDSWKGNNQYEKRGS